MKKKLSFKGIWTILKNAFNGFSDDKVFKLSGSLAYFTIFSIGPMLIVMIFFADIFYGRDAVEGTVYGQIKSFVGADAALQIQEMIRNATLSGKSNFTAIVGFVTLLVGATTVFAEIQDSVNIIWNLKPKPKKGWLKMIFNRLISFSVVIGLGFILLVSLIINGLIEGFMDRLQANFPNLTVVIVYILNLLITFIVISGLFTVIFKVLPDAKIKWKDVMVGAMTTAVFFYDWKIRHHFLYRQCQCRKYLWRRRFDGGVIVVGVLFFGHIIFRCGIYQGIRSALRFPYLSKPVCGVDKKC